MTLWWMYLVFGKSTSKILWLEKAIFMNIDEYYFLCISYPSFSLSMYMYVCCMRTCVWRIHMVPMCLEAEEDTEYHLCLILWKQGLSSKRELVWRPETPSDPPVSATLELHTCAVGFWCECGIQTQSSCVGSKCHLPTEASSLPVPALEIFTMLSWRSYCNLRTDDKTIVR